MIKKFINSLIDKTIASKSEYFKNILTLLSGTAFAQLILLLITPILSRVYDPESFGDYTILLSIVNVLTVFATGRYELAILLPKNSIWAKQILYLVAIISAVFCIFLLPIIVIFNSFLQKTFNLSHASSVLFLVPLLVFINANLSSLLYWFNRKRQYKKISFNKISESIVTSGVSILLGIFKWPQGLILGRILGQLTALFLYGKSANWRDISTFRISKKRLSYVAKRYINFPKFLVAAHFFNTSAYEAPGLIINYYFGNSILGFYGFANRIATAPLSLMAGSIGNVFREEAARHYISNGNCHTIYTATLKTLLKLSIVPFILFFIFAPDIFRIIFGEKWITAGYYARYMTPMYFFQFISNPLSVVFLITEKQRVDFLWQIFLFVLNITIVVLGSLFFDIKTTLIIFSLGYSIMYLINILLSYHFSKGK
ncbi:oligosaccharide flippase family protein (plasmid) [Chryseobacterium panacisoli]|uniref:Oligosaccharide flippase family protein n=1 Tax=Chryseobacterium panacisoli TaxID=1807141 RepID=A0A5D8ZZJ6_9FLAO|nr:oligosaccharide flippase family protein [Chryseobacterium panacisoli]TZF99766.1 oligosaccharide flippase family protein [Chryseobacterium panacisoli]